jgi:hypothetical protein
MRRLIDRQDITQRELDDLLAAYQAQPVGDGYIDSILPLDAAVRMVAELEQMSVAIERVTWWCHCTPESRLALGCHHGLGGPRNQFGEGWFSECVFYPDLYLPERGVDLDAADVDPAELAVSCGRLTRHYLEHVLPSEGFYRPCLQPGLWLYVPDDWRRRHY